MSSETEVTQRHRLGRASGQQGTPRRYHGADTDCRAFTPFASAS